MNHPQYLWAVILSYYDSWNISSTYFIGIGVGMTIFEWHRVPFKPMFSLKRCDKRAYNSAEKMDVCMYVLTMPSLIVASAAPLIQPPPTHVAVIVNIPRGLDYSSVLVLLFGCVLEQILSLLDFMISPTYKVVYISPSQHHIICIGYSWLCIFVPFLSPLHKPAGYYP